MQCGEDIFTDGKNVKKEGKKKERKKNETERKND
jgi:hypothetical protein